MESVRRHGVGVSPGVAIASAILVEPLVSHVPRFDLPADGVDREIARFDAAVARVRDEMAAIEARADRELGTAVAQIIDAQRLMLDDEGFLRRMRERIRELGQNAEWAVKTVADDLSARFARIADPYLRERGTDLDDLAARIVRSLLGGATLRMDALEDPVVLIAYDLSPADTAMLDREHVLGFATDVGGRTSHTAIMARSMEIPAVVGLHDVTDSVHTGDVVIIDGTEGTVVIRPDEATLAEYRARAVRYAETAEELRTGGEAPSITPDGFEVRLAANIESAEEATAALRNGAAGIGLYRSEFLYLRSRGELPDEEAQLAEYRSLLEAMGSLPVTIRTLDLGGEKDLPGVYSGLRADNALLGVRAIRHSLTHREMFEAQLRALLRASVHGDLRIIFPFVSGIEELRAARAMVETARSQVAAAGHPMRDDLQIGIMLEVPAAMLIVDHFAAEVDFFAIGTNDLIQYLLAVDRNNDAVAHLYEPLHPGVLRLLDQAVRAAREHDVPLSLCGETAADPLTAMVYLGFGIREFSMSPGSIPVIRNLVRRLPYVEAQALVTQALELHTAQEVEEFALARLMAHFPDGFLVGG